MGKARRLSSPPRGGCSRRGTAIMLGKQAMHRDAHATFEGDLSHRPSVFQLPHRPTVAQA